MNDTNSVIKVKFKELREIRLKTEKSRASTSRAAEKNALKAYDNVLQHKKATGTPLESQERC